MKKLGPGPLVLITVGFVIFTLGFFLGRNSYIDQVQSAAFNPAPLSDSSAQFRADPAPETQPSDGSIRQIININTATAQQLQELPGIGPIIAQRIVDYRDQNGAFPSVTALVHVKGVGENTLAQIIDHITVQEDTE